MDLVQCEPTFGVPLSEKTIVKILYDDDHVYVGAVCHYEDMNDLVANKLEHRDIGWYNEYCFFMPNDMVIHLVDMSDILGQFFIYYKRQKGGLYYDSRSQR